MNTAEQLLLRLLHIPADLLGIDGIVKTPDGFYLGKLVGDIGYNVFLGEPSHTTPNQEATRELWETLTPDQRQAVRLLASNPPDGSPIPLEEFGVPKEDQDDSDDSGESS